MLSEGDILYHGSYAKIESVDLLKCAPGKDFGRGFYLSPDYRQARRFIASSLRKAQAIGRAPQGQRYGYVSSFRALETRGLDVYEFPAANPTWLLYVACNRRSDLSGTLAKELDPRLEQADVVVGKIANDTTNRVITAYLNGLYGEIGSLRAEKTAIGLLLPERLKDQYCFKTEAAIAALEFIGAEKHDV